MTLHARGYRRYAGGFHDRSAAWTIFREGFALAAKSTGFKVLSIILLVIYVIHVAILFVMLNVHEIIEDTWGRGEDFDFAQKSAELLVQFVMTFYGFAWLVSAFVVLLFGAGLVADDLRTRGLPLYLVRPLRPRDYVIGKTLILPALLFWCLLVPGLFLYLLAGAWQPTGTSMTWLSEHSVFPWTFVRYYVASAAGYTGVMLLLSSLSQRRGWIRVFAVGVLFGGGVVVGISTLIRGTGGLFLRYVSVSDNAGAGLTTLMIEYVGVEELDRALDLLPDPDIAMAVNVAVLLAGMAIAWRRARSVEVSG